MYRCAVSLLAAAIAMSSACLAQKRRDRLPAKRKHVEIPVEGRFDRDLAYFPCDLLTPAMVSAMSGIAEAQLRGYELGETCAYVWNDDGQAAIRRLVVEDTIDEAEKRHRGVLALDACEPIDDVGDEACVRTVVEHQDQPQHNHSVRVAVRVSNARFSVVWGQSEPVLGRLRAVALARNVVASLPDDETEPTPDADTDPTPNEPLADAIEPPADEPPPERTESPPQG